jgi:hypothetical protein
MRDYKQRRPSCRYRLAPDTCTKRGRCGTMCSWHTCRDRVAPEHLMDARVREAEERRHAGDEG